MKENSFKQITIDATGKSVGRLASNIAQLLQAKHSVNYLPSKINDVCVSVKEIMKMQLTGKKESQNFLIHHSGYPRGLKKISLVGLSRKIRVDLLRHAISNMLPKNKLRTKMMSRLKIL